MDASLKPDPHRKGSYYRRLEDIERGLRLLNTSAASAEMRFFAHYFGCEKVARGIVGIHATHPAEKVYGPNFRLKLARIKAAATTLGLPVKPQDLDWLFAAHDEQDLLQSPAPDLTNSARHLRNTLTHDFGPTNLARVSQHTVLLNPKMEALLGSIPTILAYLQAHFAGVP